MATAVKKSTKKVYGKSGQLISGGTNSISSGGTGKTTSTSNSSSQLKALSTPAIKTSAGMETADQTVARAKTMLGSAYNPNTPAPSSARMDEIAGKSFITPENKAAYESTKLSPTVQNAMATSYNTSKGISEPPTPYQGTGNAPSPAWVTAPQAAPNEQTQGAGQTSAASPYIQQLMAAMKTSSAEQNVMDQQTQADQELRNLQRGQDQTNKNLADQPIAKPFITGQQASVAQQYGIDRGGVQDRMQTLQAKLANLQAQRQSSIDVAKVGVDYGYNQDKLTQQSYENQQALARQQQAQQQYADQQAQQQYENTTRASQYTNQQAQQSYENQLAQQKANQPAKVSTTLSAQEKQTAAFQTDASKYIEQLGSNKVSWGTAFNAIKAKYPQASNELIDQTLGKQNYYGVQGNGGSGRSF